MTEPEGRPHRHTFTINRNDERADVIHDAQPSEACNTDDADRLERGATFAEAVAAQGAGATLCQHCFPEGALH